MDIRSDRDGGRENLRETLPSRFARSCDGIQLDPIEMIKRKMQLLGLSPRDMKVYFGESTGHVSDILNRRRPLTLKMIRKLHEGLGIPAEVLIREYPCCVSD